MNDDDVNLDCEAPSLEKWVISRKTCITIIIIIRIYENGRNIQESAGK